MDPVRLRAARRARPGLTALEARAAASAGLGPLDVPAGAQAAEVGSNRGVILDSQYQPWGFALLGTQWRDVSLRGGLRVVRSFPFNQAPAPSAASEPTPVVNTGLIEGSQFNAGGFSQIGLQWRGVAVGGSIGVDDYDESYGQDADGGAPAVPGGGGPRPGPVPLPIPLPALGPVNGGTIQGSQFNDGGFGNVGQQWRDVTIGGDADLVYRAYIRYPDGQGPTPPPARLAAASPTAGAAPGASVNTGLIRDGQFADGGFGNVGQQWRSVAVAGSVHTSYETWTIQPQAAPGPVGAGAPAIAGDSPNETNRGQLIGGQFSDGGFGDIGFQWQGVRVGGSVATSYNGLSIQPGRDGTGPITVADLTLGRAGPPAPHPTATTAASATVAATSAAGVVAPGTDPATNWTTNSGVVTDSQFSDGGFGDIGLQWRDVAVAGDVLAVHNSLSIQPENAGQGRIAVAGVRFPDRPWNPAAPGVDAAPRVLPADPAPISDRAGTPGPLPTPTGDRDQTFASNSATSSGPVTDSQFSDGGFGDIGLQWSHVGVGGSVRLVHNALAIQPEGSNLAGVSVSDIHFGSPAPATASASPSPATGPHRSRPISLTIQPPRAGSPVLARKFLESLAHPPAPPEGPTNVRALEGRQTATGPLANVTLQWLNSRRTPDDLVVVHNVLSIQGWGSRTGRITLDGVQFAAGTPRVNALPLAAMRALARVSASAPGSTASAVVARPDGRGPALLTVETAAAGAPVVDHSTNSGTLQGTQFSDGGFGDVGLQWRDVQVAGGVDVVHNSLSVQITGDQTGPIDVSDVSFASGVLDPTPGPDAGRTLTIVPPPRFQWRNWGPPVGTVSPRPEVPRVIERGTNRGLIAGGQFSAGGFGSVAMQAAGVAIPGHVTVVHNVLEVRTAGHTTGPITLRRIRFE